MTRKSTIFNRQSTIVNRNWRIGAAVLLIAATAVVYARAMRSPFQFDDEAGIIQNPSIQNISDIRAIVSYKPELPRPLFNLSLAIDYRFYDFNALGYHLTNLVIHLLGVLLVWWLASEVNRRIEENKGARPCAPAASLMAAFIFALHPLATEPTIYVWSRSSSMMAVFCIASVAGYIRAWRAGGAVFWLAFSWCAFLMGVLSKEEAVCLPGLLLLIDWALMPREGRLRRLLAQAPFWLVPASAAIYRLATRAGMYDLITWRASQTDEYGELVIEHGVGGMALINLITQLKVGLYYALMLIWPVNQSVDHGVSFEAGFPGAIAVAGILFTVAAAVMFFMGRGRWPRASLMVAFFFVPLLVFYAVPVSDAMVERRLYLPLVGWAILLGGAMDRLSGADFWTEMVPAGSFRKPARIAVCFVLLPLMLGVMTFKRTGVWSDRLSLWSDAVRVSPDKLRPRVMLGRYHYNEGNFYRSIHENLMAIRIKPNYGPPIVNLGLIYLNNNDPETAERYFRKAVNWHSGSDFAARFNLAIALERMGRYDEAVEQYRQTIRINRGHALARQGLGRLLAMHGKTDEALRLFQEALSINPDLVVARMNMGNLLLDAGRVSEGVRELERAARSAPENGLAWYNLGMAYLGQGRLLQAERALETARKNPAYPEALFGLAQVRFYQKRDREGRELLKRFLMSVDLRRRPELEHLVAQARQALE